jgi:hypothetical protein
MRFVAPENPHNDIPKIRGYIVHSSVVVLMYAGEINADTATNQS